MKPLQYKTWHPPTTSSTLCRTPHPNNKEDKNTNPIISRQDYHLTQPCPSEEKQINKQKLSSVTQSCLTLCDPMNSSTPGLSVHHQLLEFTQTHVHQVSDAIQPSQSSVVRFSSCPQSLPASGSFQMSQLFTSGGQSIGVSVSKSVLPMNTQD